MIVPIDGAGRLVVPKPIRARLRLEPGARVEVREHDGVIEIRPAPAEVAISPGHGGPVARPVTELPPLTDEIVRDTLGAVRG